MHYRTNKKYIYPIARLCNNQYRLQYHDALDYGLGIFIDIYPLDYCGNTKKQALKALKKCRISRYLLSLSGLPKYVKSYSNFVHNFLRFPAYLIGKAIGSYKLCKHIDRCAYKLNKKYSDYSLNCVWQIYGQKEFLENKMLSQFTNIPFEGQLYPVPSCYKDILTSIYGNYMELPPKNERIGHHNYKAFSLE